MSEETTGASRRCCNRRGCPYYQRTITHQRHVGATPYMSANEGTSTQFLYFGPNFVGSPSGEIREFQDCNSDTDVPIAAVPSLAHSLHHAASVLSRSDSSNYEIMLRQIISLSNRLLYGLGKSDQLLGEVGRNAGQTPPAIAAADEGAGTQAVYAKSGVNIIGAAEPSAMQITAQNHKNVQTSGIIGVPGFHSVNSNISEVRTKDAAVPAMTGYATNQGHMNEMPGMTTSYPAGMPGMTAYPAGIQQQPTSGMTVSPAYASAAVMPNMAQFTAAVAMNVPQTQRIGDMQTQTNQFSNALPSKVTVHEPSNQTFGTISRIGDVAPSSANALSATVNSQNLPLDLRMLRIEPIRITIPFTLHFQTCVPPDCGEDQQSARIYPTASIEPIRTAAFSKPSNTAYSVQPNLAIQPYWGGANAIPAQYAAMQQQQQPQQQQPYTVPSAYVAPPPPLQTQQQPQSMAGSHAYVPPPTPLLSNLQQPTYTTTAQPAVSYTSATQPEEHFPYSANEQAQLYVSQGKFPPLTGDTSSYGNLDREKVKGEPLPIPVSTGPPFLQQPWTYPQSEPTQTSELVPPSSSGGTSAVMEVDKAVQTERPSKVREEARRLRQQEQEQQSSPQPTQPQPPPQIQIQTQPPLEIDTEATESYSQADSHRNHAYIINTTEPTSESQSRSPNDNKFDEVKLYRTEFTIDEELSAIVHTTTTTDRWTTGVIEMDIEMELEASDEAEITQPLMLDKATTTRKEKKPKCKPKHDDNLEREQDMYAKPPSPPTLDTSGEYMRMPLRMSYPSQYLRTSNLQDEQQYHHQQQQQQQQATCMHQQQQSPQLQQQPPLHAHAHTQRTTSYTCYTAAFKQTPSPSQSQSPCALCGTQQTQTTESLPLSCTCCCRQRRKVRCPNKRRDRSETSTETKICTSSSRSIRRTSSLRFGDEDYFTADSESENDCRHQHKLATKKAKSNIRRKQQPPCARSASVVQLTAMSPEQCMMLKVMEQMMNILCRMDASQRCLKPSDDPAHNNNDNVSVKTLYQSSRTDAMTKGSNATNSRSDLICAHEDEDERSAVAPSILAGYEADFDERNSQKSENRSRRVSIRSTDEAQESCEMIAYTSNAQRERRSSNCSAIAPATNANATVSNCNMPILVITFDRETCMPCCCVHTGPIQGPCESIPVFEIKSCNDGVRPEQPQQQQVCANDCVETQQQPYSQIPEPPFSGEEYYDEDETTTTHFEVHIHDQVHIVQNDECRNGSGITTTAADGIVDIQMGHVRVSAMQIECEEDCVCTDEDEVLCPALCCEATQTEDCCIMPKTGQEIVRLSAELIEDFSDYIDYEEGSGSHHSVRNQPKCKPNKVTKPRRLSKSSDSKVSDKGEKPECDCCHCRAERAKKQECEKQPRPPCAAACLNANDCKQQLKNIVDSIITDLECMEKVRKRINGEETTEPIIPKTPPQHARQSFPVTILEVCELGLSSLYVKWVIHDCFGIGGYEIYVDGYLTNRYYNARHEAAVICDVDVTQAHKVCLIAKPKAEKALMGAGDLLDEDCQPPKTPATWSPSIFLYEPSPEMDYCKRFRR